METREEQTHGHTLMSLNGAHRENTELIHTASHTHTAVLNKG